MTRTASLALTLLCVTSSAGAHEWYPNNCCGGRDCRVVACDQIHSDGNRWEYSGRFIEKFKTQVSPDGSCHICSNALSGILCIFLGGGV